MEKLDQQVMDLSGSGGLQGQLLVVGDFRGGSRLVLPSFKSGAIGDLWYPHHLCCFGLSSPCPGPHP